MRVLPIPGLALLAFSAALAAAVRAPFPSQGMVEEAELVASGASPSDWFGHAVAMAGDTVLVGVPRDDDRGTDAGAAYVFVHDATGWHEQAKLVAADGSSGDQFGWSVALSLDTAVVGAHLDLIGGVQKGSAYVFVRSGSTWSQQAQLVAGDGAAEDYFGVAVSVSGDAAVIGAYGDDVGGTNQGSAYVFRRAGSVWGQETKFLATFGAAYDYFGRSVSIVGNRAVVGADGEDDSAPGSGAAYVFERAFGVWGQVKMLKPAYPGYYARFGKSVSLSPAGGTIAIGEPYSDIGERDAGQAYVFTGSGTAWTQVATLRPADPGVGFNFGEAVHAEDARIAVGVPGDDQAGTGAGAVHLFSPVGGPWVLEEEVTAASPVAGDQLGRSVALAGDALLAGAPRRDTAGADAGSAIVFRYGFPAEAAFRNAGGNPASHAALTLPILGTTYTATVDLGGTTGHATAWIAGFAAPLTLTLGGGQVLLVDIADPNGELLSLPFVPGPLATFDVPIPSDPSLAGMAVATQALHIGAVQPFALSNALDLQLGY
ncbi:MAG: hypothetical protein AB1726_05405 [Planctomycetota bacterium]